MKNNDESKTIASSRERAVVLFLIGISVANLFVHGLNLHPISSSFSRSILPQTVLEEVGRMEESIYYRNYVGAYMSFMVGILVQSAISTVLIIFLISRRALNFIGLNERKSLEGAAPFLGVLIVYGAGQTFFFVDGASVFFSSNPRIGGASFFVGLLFVFIPWLVVLPALATFITAPLVFNSKHRKGTRK